MENFFLKATDQHVRKERNRARDLRQTAWWKELRGRGVCQYCRQKFSPNELTMDHKLPIAQGGTSEKSNIVCACKNCNTQKKYYSTVDLILDGRDPYLAE